MKTCDNCAKEINMNCKEDERYKKIIKEYEELNN